MRAIVLWVVIIAMCIGAFFLIAWLPALVFTVIMIGSAIKRRAWKNP